jgi:DNA polymerase elongation subunit (family B)
LDFSGLYKWIVFLPSKTHPRVPVSNRYYGVKTDGTIKIRGIDARRRDTPKFVYNAQFDMLQALSSAENSQEFIKKIPDALKVVKTYKKKLLDHEIPVWDLVITKCLSKQTHEYSHNISQRIAGTQLLTEGFEVYPGRSVKYVFTDAQNKQPLSRVKPKELVDEKTPTDAKKYLSLLYSAASNLLGQFGFCPKTISEYVSGYQTPKIEKMLKIYD